MGEIVKNICSGNSYNNNVVRITFKEGKRITDYAKVISEKLDVSYEEVINTMNDTNYLKSLQQDYWFLTNDIFCSFYFFAFLYILIICLFRNTVINSFNFWIICTKLF